MTEDSQLLVLGGDERTAGGFAALVERHIDFVYAAALRQTGEPHSAEDITQAVFLLFSQRAGRLKPGTLVKGWLFNTTRYVVANVRRAEARRKMHEREAAAMRSETVHDDDWDSAVPHLDDALAGLSEKDRRILLLRYFEGLPIAALGKTLGISEYAAQKRIGRALDRLRNFLASRGAAVAGVSLGEMLNVTSAHAAPAHLAKATIELTASGATGAVHSGPAFTLAKGAGQMMVRARAKLLAIQFAIAAASIVAITGLALPKLRPVPPVPPATRVMADVPDPAKPSDEDYNACCQVLRSILDGYDNNDVAAVQALSYFKPGSDPKQIDAMNQIIVMDVASYHLSKVAVDRFGMHGSMLATQVGTPVASILSVLSRISPRNVRVTGDSLAIFPSPDSGGGSDNAIYFQRVAGAWKLDTGRAGRVTYRAVRTQPVAGETSQQVFAAGVQLISRQFDAIANDIEKGRIPDEGAAQQRVNASWAELNSQFRAFACNTEPR